MSQSGPRRCLDERLDERWISSLPGRHGVATIRKRRGHPSSTSDTPSRTRGHAGRSPSRSSGARSRLISPLDRTTTPPSTKPTQSLRTSCACWPSPAAHRRPRRPHCRGTRSRQQGDHTRRRHGDHRPLPAPRSHASAARRSQPTPAPPPRARRQPARSAESSTPEHSPSGATSSSARASSGRRATRGWNSSLTNSPTSNSSCPASSHPAGTLPAQRARPGAP